MHDNFDISANDAGSYFACNQQSVYRSESVKAEGWELQTTYKIHIDSGRNDAVVPSIPPITRIEWSSSSDVIDHASEKANSPPSLLGA